jgi:hypothetical protein
MGSGILILVAGIGFLFAGVIFATDAWGITQRYYRYTIRSWQWMGFERWIRRMPYWKFRLQLSLGIPMGILMIAVGIHFLITQT